eukprot:GHVL01005141.1.p1 GENE.GHVL01005141.1~~GHVL01005141.1.p1  ORF type:complete len:221 (+),score=42.56 GHVL01005141.1:833-1495(+)
MELEMEIDVLEDKKQELQSHLQLSKVKKDQLQSRNLELEEDLRFLRQGKCDAVESNTTVQTNIRTTKEDIHYIREMKTKEIEMMEEVAHYKTRAELSAKKVEELSGDITALRQALAEYSTSFKQVSEELLGMQQQIVHKTDATSLFDEISNAVGERQAHDRLNISNRSEQNQLNISSRSIEHSRQPSLRLPDFVPAFYQGRPSLDGSRHSVCCENPVTIL